MNTIVNKSLRRAKKYVKKFQSQLRNKLHYYDSESKLALDAQEYWRQDYTKENLAQDAHWKDKGIFRDTERWLSLGKEHIELIMKYASVYNIQFPVKKIVEWGCGGGANAVHFAKYTNEFIGIDITQESLTECKSQLDEIGFNNFRPVFIDLQTPEFIRDCNVLDIDIFLCLYVYETFPSPAYGLKILELAYHMLKRNGMAFIQIKYYDGYKKLKPRRSGYRSNPYWMTTYTLEEFWNRSSEIGFTPLGIYLKPHQPLVRDSNYAYYFLRK